MNASDSYGFVKHNLEIFGFGNDTQAMITSFLELLDNSIDGVLANKTVSADERMIDFSVTPSSKAGEYRFLVIDNGSNHDSE